jgi:cell division protein FtsZ
MTGQLRQRMLIGVGNAGVGILDRLNIENPGVTGTLIINNDPESLGASIVTKKMTLPPGDVREGFLSIEDDFVKAIEGSASVLFCAGLGGDTASLMIPLLAARAKTMGLVTLACVGIPFGFEGKQKRELANSALKKLHGVCDAVAVIENDRLTGTDPTQTSVGSAFQLSDDLLYSSVRAVQGMLITTGPMKITRGDLALALGKASPMHFGHGRSEGGNRLHEALERALRSPLMKKKEGLPVISEAGMILLLLKGPKDLSFAEMQVAVEEIERIAGKKCQIKVGVDANLFSTSELEIFIIVTTDESEVSEQENNFAGVVLKDSPVTSTQMRPKREIANKAKQTTPAVKSTSATNQTQGVLELNSYQRGRFDKSEPTIFEGEDLDVPTFLRRGIKLVAPPK